MKPRKIQSDKSRLTAFWLCILFGYFGAHRFYVGRLVTGFLMLISFGGLGLWATFDLFKIVFGFFKDEDSLKLKAWAKSNSFIKVTLSLLALPIIGYFLFHSGLFKLKELKHLNSISNFIGKPTSTETTLETNGTTIREDKSSEIIKYIDDNGVAHFVNDIEKIPSKYRGNIDSTLELPALNVTK